jgi:NitT/TauT family transport system substrate-binding protein
MSPSRCHAVAITRRVVPRRTGAAPRRIAAAWLAVCALVLACCGGDNRGVNGDEDAGAKSVSLILPFQQSTSFYSTLLADELGYFADEGLDVTVEPSGGGSVALQQVIAGNQDLGLVSPGLILTAAAEGNELNVPYTDKHRNLFSIVVPEGSDITSVEDLKGRNIGITDFGGGELPVTRAALDLAGLKEDADVQLLVVGEGGPAVIDALNSGTIDAYAASWSDFFPLTVAGLNLTEILQQELATLPSEVLVTTKEYADANGAVIDGVTRALAKGSYFASYDADATVSVLSKRIPEETADPATAKRALELWLRIADYPKVDGEVRFGQHNPEAWERLKAVLGNVAEVDRVDVSQILDNSHLDAANDFDRAKVEADADER